MTGQAEEPQTQEEQPQKPQEGHERLYSIIMDGDEVTWQSLIMGLVKEEGMDPWDIDVSKLTGRFLETLKKLKEMNLRISGKVLLAAALLVRIKSVRLVGEDMLAFDQMLASTEQEDIYEGEDGGYYSEEEMRDRIEKERGYTLVPRTPQPRKRKVSVVDLIEALEQALNVKKRRVLRQEAGEGPEMMIPAKSIDLSVLMARLMKEIEDYLGSQEASRLKFTDLCPEDASKLDKVFTFRPLLHLATGRQIDLDQKDHFGEIGIKKANVPKHLMPEFSKEKEAKN